MMLEGVKALQSDPATQVLLLVSKPPDPAVMQKILAQVQAGDKPAEKAPEKVFSFEGLVPGYYNDGPIRNLLPNQQLLTGSADVRADELDFVLVWPREADNLGAFGRILAVRGDHIEARWEPLPFLN